MTFNSPRKEVLMLRGTPFHPRVQALCVSHDWRRWAGYVVASKYDLTPEWEYHAIRNSAALIDVSPLYKYHIEGRDAEKLLNRVLCRSASKLHPGRAIYATWCDEQGKTLDDGVVARLRPDAFRLTAADPNLRWLALNARSLDVTVTDVSERLATLAVQGPLARRVVSAAAEADLDDLRYFGLREASIAGHAVTISRTGYTGDLGYEIWMPAQSALDIWDRLVAVGGVYHLTPAGMLALDMARIEAGLILIEVDYVSARHATITSQKSSPFELGLDWTVDLEKPGYFVGRRALETEKERGSAWTIAGIEVDWPSLESLFTRAHLPPAVPHTAWRGSVPLYSGSREVGYATSVCFSPLLKRYIALATLRRDNATVGTELEMEVTVEHMRRRARARVTPTPFYDPERKRKVGA